MVGRGRCIASRGAETSIYTALLKKVGVQRADRISLGALQHILSSTFSMPDRFSFRAFSQIAFCAFLPSKAFSRKRDRSHLLPALFVAAFAASLSSVSLICKLQPHKPDVITCSVEGTFAICFRLKGRDHLAPQGSGQATRRATRPRSVDRSPLQ